MIALAQVVVYKSFVLRTVVVHSAPPDSQEKRSRSDSLNFEVTCAQKHLEHWPTAKSLMGTRNLESPLGRMESL